MNEMNFSITDITDILDNETKYLDHARSREWWDRWYLGLAEYYASASKDPSTKVGAVLVDDKGCIVGMGYNGFPRGVADSPDRLNDRETKYKFVDHAEVNAVLMAGDKARGATLYVWPSFQLPPVCHECCKVIIQAGVREVVGWEPDPSDERVKRWAGSISISEIMCKESGVKIRGVK